MTQPSACFTSTRLPNRRRFLDCFGVQLDQAQRDGGELALLLVDLDQFKEVNDTLGHDTGDLLLADVGRRIAHCVGPSVPLARLGGDEFAIVVASPHDGVHLETVAQAVIDALAVPFQVGAETLFISASIGIARYPHDAAAIDALLRHADQAMYAAKNAGRNRYAFFTRALQEAAHARMRMANELRGALAAQQFEIYLQPIVALESGAILKAEALLRWNHPQRGVVNPAEFIGLAETSGMIIEIGEWVFRQAASCLQRLQAQGNDQLQISINVSPVQFRNDAALGDAWLSHLAELGLAPSRLVIEMTESLLLDVTSEVRSKLMAFANSGVQLALDDFGTGYSSLAYLKKFDIDYLKIDRAFVCNLATSTDDLVLCEAIIAMAHKLGLQVIAEGVETEAQSALLAAAGCDFVQGFLYARPLPLAQFDALLAAG